MTGKERLFEGFYVHTYMNKTEGDLKNKEP